MKISATTLGCPEWNLDKILNKFKNMGFDGVDFRGVLNEIDITKLPEFTTKINETREKLIDYGLEVSGISSSIKLCEKTALDDNIEEAKRTIPVAHELGAENVRVFGMGDLRESSKEELAEIGYTCMTKLLALDGADEINWLFETHDNWVSAKDCKLLLDAINNPSFGALWDIGHTTRVGGETPAQSYSEIGSRVGYIHLKDAIFDQTHLQAMDDGWRYVLPGTGELPLAEALNLLKANDYGGWLMFEHEKRWHQNLAEPEIAFNSFIKWIKQLL